ncbi:hypothetical protein ACT5YR_07660 [Fructobacillus fructosus]|uniref:hypothetical protein n=1 Tax=Fructobacillus fructosus TaxID=1631 RepID=UPI00403499F3
MTNSMFWNEVIGWALTGLAVIGFCNLVRVSIRLWNEDLHTDNDIRNDLRRDKTPKQSRRLAKAQKKALKAATKRAKA